MFIIKIKEPDLTLTKLAQIAQAMEDASHYTTNSREKSNFITSCRITEQT